MKKAIPAEILKALSALDTCTVSNAIDTLRLRLRNEGYTDTTIRCMSPSLPPMVGHAVTVRIRCSNPQPEGHAYIDRTDWWAHLRSIPAPRVIVIQDMDAHPGTGAFPGEVHSAIWRAMDCVGAITNGAVHDLHQVTRSGFHLFASGLTASHAYAHIVGYGEPVEIGGLMIAPGNLLHGDVNGVVSIPEAAVAQIPDIAAKLLRRERSILDLCASEGFTLEALLKAVEAPLE